MTGSTFSCPACGASLELTTSENFIKCPFCQNTVVVPFDLLRSLPQNRSVDQETNQPALEPRVPLPPDEDMPPDDPALVRQKVADLLRQGQKIEAIKELRMAFPIGLAEAKSIADAMQAGQQVDLEGLKTHTSLNASSTGPDTVTNIIQYLQQGQKIEAIKAYRAKHNVGLKEAKDAVDEMEAAFLAQGGQISSPKSPSSNLSSVLIVFFVFLVVIFLAITLLAVH